MGVFLCEIGIDDISIRSHQHYLYICFSCYILLHFSKYTGICHNIIVARKISDAQVVSVITNTVRFRKGKPVCFLFLLKFFETF